MEHFNRRKFLAQALSASTAGLYEFSHNSIRVEANPGENDIDNVMKSFLQESVVPRNVIDWFLDPGKTHWAKFDTEIGYTLQDTIRKDGLDGCYTFQSYPHPGARKMINFADKPCRINTYGNSFTQCSQGSDGETWQEILAAHLGEPIRNFGIGSQGFYQAYYRMRRHEATSFGAKYIILNIYDDDHLRSIDAWRWIRLPYSRKQNAIDGKTHFHPVPWVHPRIHLETGKFVELDNPFPTPESLYNLCDADYIYETFKDDIVVKLHIAKVFGKADNDNIKAFKKLADILNIPTDFTSTAAIRETANKLHWAYGFRASEYIIEQATAFAKSHNKKVMILLSFSRNNMIKACAGQPRFDQAFIDYLKANDIIHVDIMEKHIKDFKNFCISPEDYVKRYYIGHYSPMGNHFFAFAIKDALVNWLNPKPLAYSGKKPSLIDVY